MLVAERGDYDDAPEYDDWVACVMIDAVCPPDPALNIVNCDTVLVVVVVTAPPPAAAEEEVLLICTAAVDIALLPDVDVGDNSDIAVSLSVPLPPPPLASSDVWVANR